ncbi:HNH endonuclease [Janthinobacterium sp. SUN118]|uniref:HNH endonuclease n=1 Tax=Janthinobacterium sp. SUN118 TaxID=3004100 RepID=UPI0025B12CF5|nr:HNH endonuclease [Janthinobacterium sp. SUN118]MDN2710652.1 HNH endonuclease [Janthinobacterium sp. SUN118]
MELNYEKLIAELRYERETGLFFRVRTASSNAVKGSIAGSIGGAGYVLIKISGVNHAAHRLAWLHEYRSWPDDQVDHVNGIKTDNRIANLRACTSAQNRCNRGKTVANKSGLKGVYWHKKDQRWVAQIRANGKRFLLGNFKNKEDAHQAYRAAALKHHGEFSGV